MSGRGQPVGKGAPGTGLARLREGQTEPGRLRRSGRLGHPSANSPALAALEGGGVSVQVALGEVATEVLEKTGVLFGLDPPRHHLELEHVGHRDQCGDDGLASASAAKLLTNERSILSAVTAT